MAILSEHEIKAGELPFFLRTIAEVTGSVETAVHVARNYSGMTIRVPREMPPDHKWSILLGHEAAQKLAKALGGERYIIPSAIALLRHHDARNMRRNGASMSEIARALGISLRQASKLTSDIKVDIRTGHTPAVSDGQIQTDR